MADRVARYQTDYYVRPVLCYVLVPRNYCGCFEGDIAVFGFPFSSFYLSTLVKEVLFELMGGEPVLGDAFCYYLFSLFVCSLC